MVDVLEAGREAIKDRDWVRAFELLSEADKTLDLGPEDLDKLGEASITIGRYDVAQRIRERVFAAYKARDELQAAARVAVWLAAENYVRGRLAVGQGWHATAERILQDTPECSSHGLLAWLSGQVKVIGGADLEGAWNDSKEAIRIGRHFADPDVEHVGLAMGARALVLLGRVDEGLAQMDAAMTTALTGELTPYCARIVFCHVLCGCHELGDYPRAGEWSDAAESCCAGRSIVVTSGDCRIHKASLLRWRGAWQQAEAEARRGTEELGGEALHAALAYTELGEICLRRGDLVRADEAFRYAQERGHHAQPGRALLALAEGKVRSAAAMICDELEDAEVPLSRAALLPSQVEIALAADDVATARTAAEEMAELAGAYATPALKAASETAAGAVALAAGDPAGAAAPLRRCLRRWHKIGARYEAARVRMLLARAHLAEGDADSAAWEIKAARATFDELGALLDNRRAAELLREIGAAGDPKTGMRARRAFMFTDIVNSTPLVEAIGDDAWADLRHWHDVVLRTLFASHQGDEIDHAGDGFFVSFATAERALDCAIATQRALAEHRRTQGFAPQVRIGVHLAEATLTGEGYAGRGVHVAARIGALAEGGEIVVSRETLPDDAISLAGDPWLVTLKGVAGPVEVLRVQWR